MRKKSRNHKPDYDAVTELLGEMILLAIMLLVVGIFASNVSSFIPSPKEPSVTILSEKSGDIFSLYHKGGDSIPVADFRIYCNDKLVPFSISPASNSFSLGDVISVEGVYGNERVKLVGKRSVIFQGIIP